MHTLPAIEVKPVYGYGWFIGGEPRREVPAVFTMRLEHSEPKSWNGVVLTEGHEFEGRRVTLTPRHLEWSGYVNIAVETDRPTSGSGELGALPSLHES